MSSAPLLLVEIRKRLSARSLDLADLMAEADRRKLGKITRAEFQRILSSREIQLNSSQLAVLEAEFAVPQNPNQIDSRKFMEAYANPQSSTDAPSPPPLAAFKQFVVSRRVSILDALRAFDRTNRGVVSKEDFVRAFNDFKGASQIADYFAQKIDGKIRYQEIPDALISGKRIREQKRKDEESNIRFKLVD
jgi:Ca2+-binding EF-hand superfamily protein